MPVITQLMRGQAEGVAVFHMVMGVASEKVDDFAPSRLRSDCESNRRDQKQNVAGEFAHARSKERDSESLVKRGQNHK